MTDETKAISARQPHQAGNGNAPAIAFGPFVADRASGVLRRNGDDVHVPPKAFDALLFLLERAGAVVVKDELLERVWTGTTVADGSLTETIRTLRNILGDDPKQPTYIQTVHRRGYRFIAETRRLQAVKLPEIERVPAPVSPAPVASPGTSAAVFPTVGPTRPTPARNSWVPLASFVLGALVGIGSIWFIGSTPITPDVLAGPSGQTAKLFVGAVGRATPIYRYDVGEMGEPVLDLVIEHPTLEGPGFFAVSPRDELFVMNYANGSITRFLDPWGKPVFNGTLTSEGFRVPHWGTFRGNELFVADSETGVWRFAFDDTGRPISKGTVTGPAGVAKVNPATGELFVCCFPYPDLHIARFVFDEAGDPVPNGNVRGGGMNLSHDMAFSPWGELFVANYRDDTISRFLFDEDGKALPNGVVAGGAMWDPIGLDFSPWGELFVANRNDGIISRFVFDASGAHYNGSFPNPRGVHDIKFGPAVADPLTADSAR